MTENLEEKEILEDKEVMADIKEGERNIKKGKTKKLVY